MDLVHVPFSMILISILSALGIVLPILGLLIPLLPYILAVPVALIRRDPHGPFVPRQRAVAALSVGLACMVLGLLAFVAVQPRFFRPSRTTALQTSASGTTAAALRAAITPEATAWTDSFPCGGVVVGIVYPAGSEVFGFGRSSLDRDTPPNGETVFEIGGLTQVFTGSLFARLVEQDVVRMNEPAQIFVPDSVSVPVIENHAIELRHLATGSSGLPRLDAVSVTALDLFPPFSRAGSSRSTKWLYGTLSSIDIERRPGTSFDNSDLGYGLLGHVLQRATRTDYDTLLQREICLPLGLKDTRVGLTPSMKKRLAPGVKMGWGSYRGWAVASPTRRWSAGAIPGASHLHSTANDLIVYLWANLGLSKGPLATSIAETQRPRLKVLGKPDVGLGWFLEDLEGGETLIWQHGSAGASRSFVGFVWSRAVGVVVLSNTPIDADQLGRSVLRRLLGPDASSQGSS